MDEPCGYVLYRYVATSSVMCGGIHYLCTTVRNVIRGVRVTVNSHSVMAIPKEQVRIKVIVLGCANVGKTSIMERFATGKFSGIRRPTLGADFMSKKLDIHDCIVNLQIWDTAGQERFHQGSLGSSFYRGAHGALLVYDVNNAKSIEQISMWENECLSKHESSNFFPIVIIGNKVDMRESIDPSQRVDQAPLLAWCRERAYGHVETSAKDGSGVQAAILVITALALEYERNVPQNSDSFKGRDSVTLNQPYVQKSANCC
jgi:Ras-related protein Rab-7A